MMRTMKILQIVSTIASIASFAMSLTTFIISRGEANQCSKFSSELDSVEATLEQIQEQLLTLCCNMCPAVV